MRLPSLRRTVGGEYLGMAFYVLPVDRLIVLWPPGLSVGPTSVDL